MSVLLFTRHRLHNPHSCTRMECSICEGGLGWCETCGGAEGSLPTDCPQQPMDWDTAQQVYEGLIDHRAGRWVRESAHRPDRIRAIRMGYPDVPPPRR